LVTLAALQCRKRDKDHKENQAGDCQDQDDLDDRKTLRTVFYLSVHKIFHLSMNLFMRL
jgi:hypothetical protein